MRDKRVPNRVHVVRPPQDDQPQSRSSQASAAQRAPQTQRRVPNRVPGQANTQKPQQKPRSSAAQNIEIVRMLAQISDKLKRSEAERYELHNELRAYRKSLKELENKTNNAGRSHSALENKIQSRDQRDGDMLQRQARFERAIKDTEEKILKSAASQAMLDKKLRETQEQQASMAETVNKTAAEQTRLSRQIDTTAQDKSRMMRKIERLEEIVIETQDAMRSKAMVLLTDQANAAKASLSAPLSGANGAPMADFDEADTSLSMMRRFINFKSLSVASMVVAALLSGWAISKIQNPAVPQIAVLENGGVARLNLDQGRWEPVTGQEAAQFQRESMSLVNADTRDADIATPNTERAVSEQPSQDVAGQSALDYNDDQLLEALENDPEGLAAQLNNIAPGATNAGADVDAGITLPDEPSVTSPVDNFETVAFAQDPALANEIAASKPQGALSARIKPDTALPNTVRDIEDQAFKGNVEAQHDLGAVYTAGHAGVKQNFDRAALWFREGADNGIANAQYNLGVLHHQGLGVDESLAKAMYWYREAAKNNHPEAEYNLGIAYIEGIGTEYNPALAAAFFERAANNGIMEAAYNLGLIYENGLLGTAKPDEALMWYKIAADQGSPDARTAMEQLAKTVQIDMQDVSKLVARMQQINQAVKGRRAGPLPSGEQAKPAVSQQSPSAKPAASSSAPVKKAPAKTSSNAQGAPKAAAEKLAAISPEAAQINNQQVLVAQIQEYLMLTNYYPGPADGVIGPQTSDAIRSFQAEQGLPVDGKPSQRLLAAMVSGAIKTLNQ